MITPVLLCGGSGSRLWPLSRKSSPKQFAPLVGQQSLYQQTLERLAAIPATAPPLILTGEDQRFTALGQMPPDGVAPGAIILEPEGRNTAPAIALAALKARADRADALILVMPTDHYVPDVDAFAEAVAALQPLVEQGALGTLGAHPDRPETGYGYIRLGEPEGSCFRIAEFVEKPTGKEAQHYLDSGEYLWNCGIFLFRAQDYLDELQRLRPDILNACTAAMEGATWDAVFLSPDREAFLSCPAESVDYALMEHTDRAVVAPLSQWSDLGDWDSLWRLSPADARDNVTRGDVLLRDGSGNYLRADGDRLVAALGIEGLLVVDTPDTVFIAPRRRAQEVKELVGELLAAGRSEAVLHRKVYRPWGWYDSLGVGRQDQVKRIQVAPGERLSLQRHARRSEHWVVVSGLARVTRGDEVFDLRANESVYIPVGVLHRLENPTDRPLEIVEVQVGDYLGEDDIERFDDDYGRGEDDR